MTQNAPMSDARMRWGILATGSIARLMTKDLLTHGHHVAAAGSRCHESAHAFAEEFGIDRAHGSYGDLVADPEVDVIYIATPHNFHMENAIAALRQGKHVLVEKAFTVNAAEAREIAELARSRGLVALEAMWPRFLPHMAFVRDVVRDGRIGRVTSIHVDHAQKLSSDPLHRLNNPALAGGALLDLGVYTLAFVHDILGTPADVLARGTLKETGVDGSVATMMVHEGSAVSMTYSSSESRGPNRAVIVGTEGRIELAPVWYTPTSVTVYDTRNEAVDSFDEPVSGRGMQYQASELERLVASGRTESTLMSLDDSIEVMEMMDVVRAHIGVRYPGEDG